VVLIQRVHRSSFVEKCRLYTAEFRHELLEIFATHRPQFDAGSLKISDKSWVLYSRVKCSPQDIDANRWYVWRATIILPTSVA
jgi:hypothetical protein